MITINPMFFFLGIYFENYKMQIIFNKKIFYNQYFLYILKEHVILINKIFLNDINFCLFSCLDLSSYFKKKKNIWWYLYIHYKFFQNYTLLLDTCKIKSLYKYYNNLSCLEREASEMFSVGIKNSYDNRNLLLDYSRKYNPMLKGFESTGFEEVYINLFDENITYINLNNIEL